MKSRPLDLDGTWSRKGPRYRAYRCPHCGKGVDSQKGRGGGRPRSCYFTADGRTLHAEAWAVELHVSVQTVKNYQKRHPTFEEAVRAIRNRFRQ